MSTTPEDVKRLAALARISVRDDALPKFAAEFESILAYVGKLDELTLPEGAGKSASALRNVMRADTDPTAPGTWTEKIVEQFPQKEGNSLSVKQIISYD